MPAVDTTLSNLNAIPVPLQSGDLIYVVRNGVSYRVDQANVGVVADNLTGTVPYARLPVGTTANTVAAGNDSRFTDSRTPTGNAGGVLSGTYPNPNFAVDMATQAELDTVSDVASGASALATATNSTLTTHVADTNNPHSVTKAQVGLGAVTNNAQALLSIYPSTLPSNAQIPIGNANAYQPGTVGGDGSLALDGTLSIRKKVTFIVTNGTSALATGVQTGFLKIPDGGTLQGWVFTAAPSGSLTFDVLRSADGGGIPSVSIVGAGIKPSVATNVESRGTNFVGWNSTALTAFDNLGINITNVVNATYGALTLYYV